MQSHDFVQVDLAGIERRFWIDSCAGRDQVALTARRGGWASYEAPLPALVLAWCHSLHPVFVDVGANTGFYSLLALAAGADFVHAFEPVAEIADVLLHNVRMSELQDQLQLHRVALADSPGEARLYFPCAEHGLVETSASLNPHFRAEHSEHREVEQTTLDLALGQLPEGRRMLLKIDVESREPDVLRGAMELLRRHRPAVVCEILPGVDTNFFEHFCREQSYVHHALDSGRPLETALITACAQHRDHLFLPHEDAALWLRALNDGAPTTGANLNSLSNTHGIAPTATTCRPEAAGCFNQGNAALRAGDSEAALLAFDAALKLQPDLLPANLQAARCLVRLGRLKEAREAFAKTLRLEPANYSAWLEAGHLCRQMGELQQATLAYQRAIHAQGNRYEAHLAMARGLEELGRAALAEEAFQEALRLSALEAAPDDASASQAGQRRARVAHRMGQYRLERGLAESAIQAFQTGLQACLGERGAATDGRAMTRERSSADQLDTAAELRMDLGEALWRLGRCEAALAQWTAASGATSEPTLARLAAMSFRFNLWQEAMSVSRRNVELHPGSATALWNLAHLLSECWQMDEAEALLARAEAMAAMPGALAMRASIASRRGDADGALRLYRELACSAAGQRQYASSAAMSSLYSDALSAREVAALHRQLFAPLGSGARKRDSFVRPPLAGRRLRLGLVTADFHHQHPVNIFMQPVLRELDRSRIELTVYFTGVSHDDQTRLAQGRAEHWVEAAALNDAQLARRIDDDGIDVLLDLAGHTGQQRMSMFAQRAAPVQASYLGYPGSTGVPNMDWLIGDAVVTPARDDGLCSEAVYRLPGMVFCYAPEADYPLRHPGADKQSRPLTFGSFNNVPKLTQRTLALWVRVLDAVPGSRLLLKAPSFGDASAVRVFGERLARLGADLSRIEFRGPTGLDVMMSEYADVDIALDPVPYNGGTTSLQALWMGVPVLTLAGGHFVSRMGASFMGAAGLGDWVAGDDDDYVAVAVRMAADRPVLRALKQGLRARLGQLPAWNPVAHTRALEQAFLHMAQSGALSDTGPSQSSHPIIGRG